MGHRFKSILDHINGGWNYDGHWVYDIQETDGSRLIRIAVQLKDRGGMDGYLQIRGAVLKHDAPLPKGVGLPEYINVLSTLENEGYLQGIESENPDIPKDYLLVRGQSIYTLVSSKEDPRYDQEIAKWLDDIFVQDDLLDRIKSMIDSIRSESASSMEKNVPDSRENSTGGDEDDIT